MAKPPVSAANVVTDVLRQVAGSSETPPLFDVHEFMNNELTGPLTFCAGPKPLHDGRLHKDTVWQGDSGDSLRPDTTEPRRRDPYVNGLGIHPRHELGEAYGVDSGGAQ